MLHYLTFDDLTEYERPVTGPLDTSFKVFTIPRGRPQWSEKNYFGRSEAPYLERRHLVRAFTLSTSGSSL